jgi:hypothetical protein
VDYTEGVPLLELGGIFEEVETGMDFQDLFEEYFVVVDGCILLLRL